MANEVKVMEQPAPADAGRTAEPDPFLVALMEEVEKGLQAEEAPKPQTEPSPPADSRRQPSPAAARRERPRFNFD
jgi:hypothetical protein